MKKFAFESENFFGDRMRQIRRRYGLRQEDIADAICVSRSTYSYYELNKTKPDPINIGRLARYLDIPIEAFYMDDLPDDMVLKDSDGKQRRSTRTATENLDKIADLSPNERALILLLRANGQVDAKDTLNYLQERLEWGKKNSKKPKE